MQKIEQLIYRPEFWAVIICSFILIFFSLFFSVYPYQMVIISIAILVIILFVLKPFLSYAMLIILLQMSNLRFVFSENYLFAIGDFFMILMLFLWIFSRLAGIAEGYKRIPIDIFLIIFFVLAMLSLTWSHDTDRGLYQLFYLFINLVFSFILTLSVVNNDKKLNTVLWIVIIMGILNSIVCFFSVSTYPDYTYAQLFESSYFDISLIFNDKSVGRRGHSFSHPLTTAYWLNFALILSFGKFITLKGRRKILIGLAMFLMLTAHLTTLSKGPLIALIAGLVFLFYSIKPIRKIITISTVLLICTIIASFILANITQIEKATQYTTHQLSSGEDTGTSMGSRIKWWGTSIQKSIENFGMGVGIGGIPQYLKPFTFHPHSTYVSVFGELGFIGLFLLLLIFFLALKSYFEVLSKHCKNEYYKRILLVYIAGFITFLIGIIADYNYIIIQIWWYIGLGFAIVRLAKQAPVEYMDKNLPFYADGKTIVA